MAERPAGRTYTVVKGDSLSKIAKAHYGKMDRWKVIYEANRAVIGSNPDLIKPGQVLTIPDL
jgi:nucleoid-associated protein YgaU